ncbi:hypothetical protein C0J52_10912 [Blattella germanica]|nr:hypothetical protein C0J52_10912 [Blattella germanica]
MEPDVIIKEEVDPLSDTDGDIAPKNVQSQDLQGFPNRNQFFLICGKPQNNNNIQGVQNSSQVEGLQNKNQLLFICGKPKVPEFISPAPSDTSPTPEARRECRWSLKSSKILIDLYDKYKPEIGTKKLRNMKEMWQLISEELSEKFKMIISPGNAENRWRVIERNYKKFINKNISGRRKKYFEYLEEMNRVFSRHKRYKIVAVSDSDSPNLPTSSSIVEKEEETPNVQETTIPETVQETKQETREESKQELASSVSHRINPVKKFKLQRNYLEKMRRGRFSMREEHFRFGFESLAIMKERNELIRERNEIMKERNKIMKDANDILRKSKCNSCKCSNSNCTSKMQNIGKY